MSEVFPRSAFNQIPPDLRVAGTFVEVDGSGRRAPSHARALLIGQKLPGGTADTGQLIRLAGQGAEAPTLFGRGSMLAGMVQAFRANNETMPLYAVAVADPPEGVRATGTITVGGTATGPGRIVLWIAGGSLRAIGDTRVAVPVSAGGSAAETARAMAAAINAAHDLPVTASADEGVVTLTARHPGAASNDIRVQVNPLGRAGGEPLPAGVTLDVSARGFLTGGAGTVDLTAAVAAMGDTAFDFIVTPWTDPVVLDALDRECERRWSPDSQLFGLYFGARAGSLSELATFGETRNSRYGVIAGGFDRPAPPWLTAARLAATVGSALASHPARALHGLVLKGELAEPEGSEMTLGDRNALLWSGLSVLDRRSDGTVATNRIITTCRVNADGDVDETFLDATTLATVQYVARELKRILNDRYVSKRCVLMEDGDEVAPGIPVCTPRLAKGTLVEHYKAMVREGIVQDAEAFEKRLHVARDGARLNVFYAPRPGDPLYIVAVQINFSLAWDQ